MAEELERIAADARDELAVERADEMEAARLRDQVLALRSLEADRQVVDTGWTDMDVFGVHHHAVAELLVADALPEPEPPRHLVGEALGAGVQTRERGGLGHGRHHPRWAAAVAHRAQWPA